MFFPFSYFDISGLGGPSWQCWEPRLPALRVGLMINPLLSYRAITTFLLVNMDWIADLLCCNKLAFFLHSYIGYSLSKESKRTQRDLGVYFVHHCTVCRAGLVKYKFRLLLMLDIFFFASSPQHWRMGKKDSKSSNSNWMQVVWSSGSVRRKCIYWPCLSQIWVVPKYRCTGAVLWGVSSELVIFSAGAGV